MKKSEYGQLLEETVWLRKERESKFRLAWLLLNRLGGEVHLDKQELDLFDAQSGVITADNSNGGLSVWIRRKQANQPKERMKKKCVKCGKDYSEHTSTERACPFGSKHRSLGYMQFHPINRFTGKPASRKDE